MPGHADILDERDSLKGPFLRAAALHLGIVAIVAGWSYFHLGGRVEKWGDPKSLGGGAVSITPVSIAMPAKEGRVNRVANDTESQVPAPPKPEPKKVVKLPEPDAIAIGKKKQKDLKKKPQPEPVTPQKYTSVPAPKENQVYSRTGQALNSPIFAQAPGGGGVGSGSTSPFGARFGWYEQLLRERVASNWRSQELDGRIRNRVSVMFEIRRDGSIGNVRISQSSGNFTLDQSAQRAIIQSNPLPALPREFER
ncbi:MAG: energy transducer TonB, partial [Bryobacteraceae bacterium]|nr:energy transducer TonB [Bryobacteraceae bacterium]